MTMSYRLLCLTVVLFASPAFAAFAAPAIQLHPQNPHYFLWRGKPTVMITSGEHYGAVVNQDFDYIRYLDTLAKDKLNLTRTFLAYREQVGAFNIAGNTLAPRQESFITPWMRSDTPGYFDGGNKFDLKRWNPAYFARLKDFVKEAGKRGIVVEANLFSCYYSDKSWDTSPFQARNNVNGIGNCPWNEALSLKHKELVSAQDEYVQKVVQELRDFDNVYYEICNEPYIGGVTMEWHDHIASVIAAAQKGFPNPKLISHNVANNWAKVENPHPAVSIFNFHYAAPPEAVVANYRLNKVIGDNETGFRGTNNAPYRMEGWDFILAGGGLYNNLDYSFICGREDGTFIFPANQPGGGNPEFRRQLGILRAFINGFDFIQLRPDATAIRGGVPLNLTARALSQPGRAYAIYLRPNLTTQFSARWTGQIEPRYSEEYTFYASSNDGVRLWIDGKQVIDHWVEQSETESTGKITLQAGKRYDVKLEYFYNGGEAAMKMAWSSASQRREIVPKNQLWLPGGGNGLKGEYFADPNLGTAWQARDDGQINFAWGTRSPFSLPDRDGAVALQLDLPAGSYFAEWISPLHGHVVREERWTQASGIRTLESPSFTEDMALRIKRRGP